LYLKDTFTAKSVNCIQKTPQTLGDKISQLNLAIDKAVTRLKHVTGSVENEAVNDETEVEPS
jgi:hypothetical protein